MTFNDFMLGILGKSLNQFYKENGIHDATKIGALSLINLRPLPTSYDNIILDNSFVSTLIELPLQNDISTIHKTIKPWLKKFSAQEFIYTSRNLISMIAYFPKKMISAFLDEASGQADVSLSNIAFSDVPWTINGKEIKNVTMNHAVAFGFTLQVMTYTYNGKVRFGLNCKKDMKMDSSRLMNIIYANIDDEIKKSCKITVSA